MAAEAPAIYIARAMTTTGLHASQARGLLSRLVAFVRVLEEDVARGDALWRQAEEVMGPLGPQAHAVARSQAAVRIEAASAPRS